MSVKTDPRVDEKIASAPAFARPILTHLRRLVHQGCPAAEETIKWQMPFFVYRGRNLCHMAAFKAHCALGFWHPAMEQALVREGLGGKSDEAAGLFGRITRQEDLPDNATLLRLITEAAGHNESDKPARPPSRGARTPAGGGRPGRSGGAAGRQREGGGGVRGFQPQSPTRVHRVDHGSQARGDAAKTSGEHSRMARGRQTAPLEEPMLKRPAAIDCD